MPNEPTDHAVARGRDVSLRHEGGHSPENHTVVLEWYWKPPTGRSGNKCSKRPERQISPQSSAEHVVVNYTTKKPKHFPRTNDHEGRNVELWCGRCRRGIQEDITYHKVSLERIRDRTTAKEQVVRIRDRTTAKEPVARRTK